MTSAPSPAASRPFQRPTEPTELRFAWAQTTLGSVLVAEGERGICAISLGDDPQTLQRELQATLPHTDLLASQSSLAATLARVVNLVEDPLRPHDLTLDLRGTPFQRSVWGALRLLPPGATTTYTALAETLGATGAVRAVAGACAANVLAVAIPCHRVLRKDGGLSGYRWGMHRKRTLLQRERAISFTQIPFFRDT